MATGDMRAAQQTIEQPRTETGQVVWVVLRTIIANSRKKEDCGTALGRRARMQFEQCKAQV
jgi:hypothetical protein